MIAQLSASERWLEPMTFLFQLTGMELYTGMCILATIGEIERFSYARKLVGYAVWEPGCMRPETLTILERFPNKEDENYVQP